MVVFDKPHALADIPTHYCPGCTHGIIHRLVAEAIDELYAVNRNILGCVLNGQDDSIFDEDAKGYGYGYRYGK